MRSSLPTELVQSERARKVGNNNIEWFRSAKIGNGQVPFRRCACFEWQPSCRFQSQIPLVISRGLHCFGPQMIPADSLGTRAMFGLRRKS